MLQVKGDNVVIRRSAGDAILVGATFIVYSTERGYVGQVRIVATDGNAAHAMVLKGYTVLPVKKGDNAISAAFTRGAVPPDRQVEGRSGEVTGQVIKAVGGIVVINRGTKQGVTVGMILTVCRGDAFIAKIKAGDVCGDMATATIVPGIESGKPILAGDCVTNTFR